MANSVTIHVRITARWDNHPEWEPYHRHTTIICTEVPHKTVDEQMTDTIAWFQQGMIDHPGSLREYNLLAIIRHNAPMFGDRPTDEDFDLMLAEGVAVTEERTA